MELGAQTLAMIDDMSKGPDEPESSAEVSKEPDCNFHDVPSSPESSKKAIKDRRKGKRVVVQIDVDTITRVASESNGRRTESDGANSPIPTHLMLKQKVRSSSPSRKMSKVEYSSNTSKGNK